MPLEQYLGKKLSEITWGRRTDKLISAEQYTLQKYNLPLIDYLVIYHNQKNRSLRDFEKELNIDRQFLVKIFDNLNLPRPDRIESMTNKWHDPVEGAKLAQSVSDRYKDPAYTEKMRKALHEAQSTPEAKAKRSELSKKMWANPEFYNRVMPKVKATLYNKWQNDPQYRENVKEGIRKFNQNPELRQKANEKLSELAKARCASDPKYTEMLRTRMKELWQDPEWREMMVAAIRESKDNPQYIERMRELAYEHWQNPQFRTKTIAGMKSKFENDLEYKEKTVQRLQSPEMRRRVSEALVKRWQNPAYKSRISKLMSDIMIAKMADPAAKEVYDAAKRKMWADPEFRKRHKERMENKWQNDKEYREKITNLMAQRWQDPQSREKILGLIREGLEEFWADPERVAARLEKITPEQREIMAETSRQIMKKLWEDPNFREKVSNADRKRWKNRGYDDSRNEYLPTYSGFRKDIGFNAKSCWEANIARIFLFCGRDFARNFPLEIKIEEEYEHIFEPGIANFFVDFVSSDKRGNSKSYEIMSHYFEYPIKIAKVDMLLNQYPNMPIRIIDSKTYRRLEKHFKNKINEDPRFVGWEETEYNIKTKPEDFENLEEGEK